MAKPAESPYRVPFDGDFRIDKAPTEPPSDAPDKKACKAALQHCIEELRDLQHILYAHDHHALLVIFQAMDAGGKDSTIRAVLSGVNPAGCKVVSFGPPSSVEQGHDFLWRTSRALPERGRIGIFNRSYYEEVLIARVHPELLAAQKIPDEHGGKTFWRNRYQSIRDHERHLADNGTVIVKFWLNVSKAEQRRRFLSRLENPRKQWKFDPADIRERGFWDNYMRAYEDALNETSRAHAPWFAIPADNKPYMRLQVARILVDTLKAMPLAYPEVPEERRQELKRIYDALKAE